MNSINDTLNTLFFKKKFKSVCIEKEASNENDFNSIFKNILLLFYFISIDRWNISVFLYLNGESYLFEQTAFNSLFTRPSIDSIPRKLLLCLQLQREYKSMWNDKYNARGKFYFPRWKSIDHAVTLYLWTSFRYENTIIYDENFLLFFFFHFLLLISFLLFLECEKNRRRLYPEK